MKLVAAKCPNCGANLDVNPKQDATKCEYCHQAILIDDAIAKYKLEISGSVEVKNLPKYDNILKLANRNYNNKEYEEAYKSYDQLLKLDADNTIALLRYGICKTLLNNYIDFTMEYLNKTFNNVINILKEKNEYDSNIDNCVKETLYATNESLEATIKYYNSYSINRFDLSQVQEKMFSCLDLYEILFDHANEEDKLEITKSIILTIDSIKKEKIYKTGRGEYGENFTQRFTLDMKTKILLEQKMRIYNSILNPAQDISNDDSKIVTSTSESVDSNVGSKNFYDKFKITIISIMGFILPPMGIILIWTWGKHFKTKNKIIATIIMAFWFMIIFSF